MAFILAAYDDFYGRKFELELRPLLEISYQRVSLVAKNGGERMTIDFALSFAGVDRSHAVDEKIVIVETKSANGNGIADKLLRELHQHATKRCSKYCIGAAILGLVGKHNNFLPVLRKVNTVPAPAVAVLPGRSRLAAPSRQPVAAGIVSSLDRQ